MRTENCPLDVRMLSHQRHRQHCFWEGGMWEGARSGALVRQVGKEWIQTLSRNFAVQRSREMEQ